MPLSSPSPPPPPLPPLLPLPPVPPPPAAALHLKRHVPRPMRNMEGRAACRVGPDRPSAAQGRCSAAPGPDMKDIADIPVESSREAQERARTCRRTVASARAACSRLKHLDWLMRFLLRWQAAAPPAYIVTILSVDREQSHAAGHLLMAIESGREHAWPTPAAPVAAQQHSRWLMHTSSAFGLLLLLDIPIASYQCNLQVEPHVLNCPWQRAGRQSSVTALCTVTCSWHGCFRAHKWVLRTDERH